MTASSPCPVCGATESTPLFLAPFPAYADDGKRAYPSSSTPPVACWRMVRCADCGAGYPSPYPDESEIRDYYASQTEPSEYEMQYYVEVSQHERDHWADFARRVTDLRATPGRLLEVGCAAGWLLAGARAAGWEAYGLEASPKFADYVRDVQRLPVVTGTIADCGPGAGNLVTDAAPFDIIVMTDVLEHLHDPVADLRTLRDLLAPDGALVIATLDLGSLSARRYGLAWRQIVVSHIVYWTRPSIRRALERAGYVVDVVDTVHSWSPDPAERRRAKVRLAAKFAARQALTWSYVPLARRSRAVQALPARASRGRLDHETLMAKIGDQPTLGDVMLVVARPAGAGATH